MVKIDLRTNISFLIILISVLLLAILQGSALSQSLLKDNLVQANEVQLIAFIVLTLFILFVVTLHPDKIYLSAYSAMTLGFIVIISAFYNLFSEIGAGNVVQFILGFLLILSGFFLNKNNRLNLKERYFVRKGIE